MLSLRSIQNAVLTRKGFICSFAAGVFVPFLIPLLDKLPVGNRLKHFLRPPGAVKESDFLDKCIACGQCANVCPNKCIQLYGLENGVEHLGTPKITARAQACILCMACTQVCPTGALEKLEPTDEGIAAVNMGKAYVSQDLCYSFAGRTCGVCYRACPLPGKALSLGIFEQPHINEEYCVGCGLCEQACIHMPQAIRIVPAHEMKS